MEDNFDKMSEDTDEKSIEPTLIIPSPSLFNYIPAPLYQSTSMRPRKTLRERGYFNVTFEDKSFPDTHKRAFSLYDRMLCMIQNNSCTDCVLQVGQYKFNCHLIVLQAYSKAFDDIGLVDKIYISNKLLDPRWFGMIYKWMTSNCPVLTREGVIKMFGTAQKLKIEPLLNHLWSCFDGNGLISEEHALSLYFEARSYKILCVQKEMLSRVQKSFLAFVSSKEFVELSLKEICELLSNNTICVNSEIEVFLSVVRWILYKPEKRMTMIKAVMKKIRFGLMSPHYLTVLKKGEDNEKLSPIFDHPFVQQLVYEGMRYSVMQIYNCHNKDLYRQWIVEENITEIPTRKWIYDRGCIYHHKAFCKYPYEVSYWTFLDYLDELRVVGLEHHYMLETQSQEESDEHPLYCCRD